MRNEVPGSTLQYYVPGSTQHISLLLYYYLLFNIINIIKIKAIDYSLSYIR